MLKTSKFILLKDMSQTFEISITAPEQSLFHGPVTMAVLPGSEGEFGVLAHHAPFATSLKEGKIKLYQGESVAHTFDISGGFAEVSANQCIVLVRK
jgi:F-type H+-transporting ATPase subunit epsilon